MNQSQDFQSLIARVQRGDQDAATQLVREFEPEVRRFIRFRLSSPSLRRTFDSLDICQSVLLRFFVDVSAGDVQLNDPRQLKALLITMARNKLYDRVRSSQADRRDARRIVSADALDAIADSATAPSELISNREVLEVVRDRLSPQEQFLWDQRLAGRPWDELATELQTTSESLRKRLTRAVDGSRSQGGEE